MKKTLFFASLIAMVAVLASCEGDKKGDAPKARFQYDVDGLTVSFQNKSQNAETYAWDFGDGSAISAEENPVHTYAEAGTYSVKLTAKNKAGENSMTESIVLEKKAFEIKVDGNFADWDVVPADLLAKAETDEMAAYEELHAIKFVADADYVYFYIQFNGEEGVVSPVDMMINTDGDNETGMAHWFWEGAGVELLIEGFPDTWAAEGEDPGNAGYQDAGIFQWIGDAPDAWAWNQLDIAGALSASALVALPNGDKAFEGSIMRASIPDLKAFKVGVFTNDANWSGENGCLPQQTITAEGNVASPMLEVKLP